MTESKDCTCWIIENPWTYYGIIEPGGAMERDPECPVHPSTAVPVEVAK